MIPALEFLQDRLNQMYPQPKIKRKPTVEKQLQNIITHWDSQRKEDHHSSRNKKHSARRR